MRSGSVIMTLVALCWPCCVGQHEFGGSSGTRPRTGWEQHRPGDPGDRGPPRQESNGQGVILGDLYEGDLKNLAENTIYLALTSATTGFIYRAEVFFSSPNDVYLQIWRRVSNTHYKLAQQYTVQCRNNNGITTVNFAREMNGMAKCPAICRGDRIGLFSLNHAIPIPATPASGARIPISQYQSELKMGTELEFSKSIQSYNFSLKVFLQQGNQRSDQTRFLPCSSEFLPVTTTGSSSKNSCLHGLPTAPSQGSSRSMTKTGPSTSPQRDTTAKTTISTAMEKHSKSGSGLLLPSVSQEPPTYSTKYADSFLKNEAESKKNVLTIIVVSLAALAIIVIVVVVVFVVQRRNHSHQRVSKQGSVGSEPVTPTTPNPAYGVSCDFLNPAAHQGNRDSVVGCHPVVPPRPSNTGGSNSPKLEENSTMKIKPGSDISGQNSRTDEVRLETGHTYLELPITDQDSGIVVMENGVSRPTSGVDTSGT